MTNLDSGKQSCLRGLSRFKLGEDFNLCELHVYNEVVEKDYNHYFPNNKKPREHTEIVAVERRE